MPTNSDPTVGQGSPSTTASLTPFSHFREFLYHFGIHADQVKEFSLDQESMHVELAMQRPTGGSFIATVMVEDWAKIAFDPLPQPEAPAEEQTKSDDLPANSSTEATTAMNNEEDH